MVVQRWMSSGRTSPVVIETREKKRYREAGNLGFAEDKRLAEDRMDNRMSYLIDETSILSLRACGLMSEEVRGRIWLARGDISTIKATTVAKLSYAYCLVPTPS